MRKPWIAAVAVAMPLTLAACGGSAPPGTEGTGGGAAGGSGDTITIGSLHPLSGAFAADGQQMDNGAQGGFNRSSQHLDRKVRRWPTEGVSSRFVRIGGRSPHRVDRRWPGGKTASGSGRRSLEA